ncbi:MAG: tetratricopeptide repeat protein [Holophaga sp.]|nr:tetratricopeptide repeat protein [Holophaga sp.]
MSSDPNRAHDLFLAARELAPDRRGDFLVRNCGADLPLREAVERQLAALEESVEQPVAFSQLSTHTDGFSKLPTGSLPGAAPVLASGVQPGTVLAERYTLIEEIGEGGMGSVWSAQQSEPVKRPVAVKLVKAGMDSKSVLARFEQERQALALMDHPNIAKVFDAGLTPTGQPFFVMELVDGQSLTRFCDEARLTARQRLELFVPICLAVQHAHQKGIVHRDLKPSNILVTLVDGKPTPKVIDFGVAKAAEGNQVDRSMATQQGAVIGTLEYMAPEQAGFLGTDIDTRADIYSLGVILYELLTGQRPIDARRLKRATLTEMVRLIQEEDPPKPSRRLATEATVAALAAARHTEPGKLMSLLRGDLDWVVMKCLEKQRERRYASANGLARDIQRYLSDEVVEARPPSTGYRMRKFLRRNRGSALAGAAVATALVLGMMAFAWQARVARQQRDLARSAEQAEAFQRRLANQERDRAVAAESQATASGAQALRDRNLAMQQKQRADAESAAAKAVNDFLQNDLLAQASADNQSGQTSKPDPDLKVRTALDRAAARVAGKFNGQPEQEAAIRNTMGRTYLDLGQYPEAVKQLERAVELYRQSLGASHPKTLNTTTQLGEIYRLQGKFTEAEVLCGRVLEISRRALGPEHPGTLNAMQVVADIYYMQSKYPEAQSLYQQVLKVRRRRLGVEHPDTLSSMNTLAANYDMQGNYPEAEALYSQTLTVRRRLLGTEHPKTLWSANELAWVYIEMGKYEQAEVLYLHTLETQRRVLGADHPSTLASSNGLGYLYLCQGKYPRAETEWRQALAISRRVHGLEHPNTLSILNNVAEVCDRQGNYTEAAAINAEALDIRSRVLGKEHPDTLSSMCNLAKGHAMQGKYAQAMTLHVQALEISRRVLGPDHPDTLNAMYWLANAISLQGNHAEAEALCQKVLEARRLTLGAEHPDTLATLTSLATFYQKQGRFPEAETCATQALAGRRKALGPDHIDTLDGTAVLGLAYLAQGKFMECEALLRSSLPLERQKRPEEWRRFHATSLLGASLAGQKKYAEAEPLLIEGCQGMVARKPHMAVPDLDYLNRAFDQLVRLYEAWGKPEQATDWRTRKNSRP